MKMTFSALESRILTDILKGSRHSRDLVLKYVTKGLCSRAGLYKAIASLKRDEVVRSKNGVISINKIWLAETQKFLQTLAPQKHEASYFAKKALNLRIGEKLTYEFRSLEDIDIFLLNILFDLLLAQGTKEILLLEDHEFFTLANNRRTASMLMEIQNLGATISLLVTCDTVPDKYAVRNLAKPVTGYVMQTEKMHACQSGKIIHLVGNIIVELKLNKTFLSAVHALFNQQQKCDQTLLQKLAKLMSQQARHTVILYKSDAKAEAIRRKFKKFF